MSGFTDREIEAAARIIEQVTGIYDAATTPVQPPRRREGE